MPRHAPSGQDHPRLGVSTFVWRDGRVLLVRRGKPPFEDVWAFPGGLVEFGEQLAAAAAREVREETAMEVDIGDPIDHAEIILADPAGRRDRHYVLVVFSGIWRSGEAVAGDDAAEARWVAPGELPLFPKTPDTERILARLLKEGVRGAASAAPEQPASQ